MIFTKVNESYDGFEVVEEGWLNSIGSCLMAVGMIGTAASPLLLPFGLSVAGTGLMTSVGLGMAGLAAIHINGKLDANKMKKIFSKSPAIVKYLDNFYKDYKKKNSKHTYFHDSDVPKEYMYDDVKSKNATISRTKNYLVNVDMGDYELAILCDDELKTISSIFLLVYKTYERTAEVKGREPGYYNVYVKIPAPSKAELEKVGLKIKK